MGTQNTKGDHDRTLRDTPIFIWNKFTEQHTRSNLAEPVAQAVFNILEYIQAKIIGVIIVQTFPQFDSQNKKEVTSGTIK